jgi:hypothetical protein
VTPAGLLSGVRAGTTTLTATKDNITSNTVNITVSAAAITAIQVTPSPLNVVEGQTQQLTATATYDNNTSSNVTSSVTWTTADTNTATVTSAGLLSGVRAGTTTLTATKDNITSNEVNVTVCSSLVGECINIFDNGNGKLFTSSPSVAYLKSIGGSTEDTYTEAANGLTGDFYLFDWTKANNLCTTYNSKNVGGRINWRLATRNELKDELYNILGNMFTARGWPISMSYWSTTQNGGDDYYDHVLLNDGFVSSNDKSFLNYASCVSTPTP